MGKILKTMGFCGVIASCVALSACGSSSSSDPTPNSSNGGTQKPGGNPPSAPQTPDTSTLKIPAAGGVSPPSSSALAKSDSDLSKRADAYNNDSYLSLDLPTVNLQSRPGQGSCSASSQVGCTLNDIQNPQKRTFARLSAQTQIGDELSAQQANSELRLAVDSHSSVELQSYHIDLKSQSWRNESQLQLNKGHDDITRLRNKLLFDLLRDIPNLPSLRSQFVQFQTDGTPRGLYTHLEAFDGGYLSRRNWPTNGRLYSAENFSFFANTGNFNLNVNGEPANREAFESQLIIHHGFNHKNLLDMLDAVNNHDSDFSQTIATYFNRNNLITWLAFNVLTYNDDSISHKFSLYNPNNSKVFYLGHTDLSEAIGRPVPFNTTSLSADDLKKRRRWGLANWGSMPLFNRFLQEPGVYEDIRKALLELRDVYVTDSRIQTLTNAYEQRINALVTQDPDKQSLKVDAEDINFGIAAQYPTPDSRLVLRSQRIQSLPQRVANNVNRHLNELKPLIPFELKAPFADGGNYVFWWRPASDPNGGNVSYDIVVSANADLSNPVYQQQGITDGDTNTSDRIEHEVPVTSYANGTYYYRVIARTDANTDAWQVGLNDEGSLIGVRRISLTAN